MNKFRQDVFWNMGSLVVLSVSGLLINVLVGRYYGAAALGYFNQVYAIYILGSQVAVGSVHLSLQKTIAAEENHRKEINSIISSGLLLTLIFAFLATFLIYLLRHFIAGSLKSQEISTGILLVLPGLIFFALNKTLLGILNGLRQMKAFAFFQAIRYILLVLVLIYVISTHIQTVRLPLIFSVAESVLFIFLFLYTFKFFNFQSGKNWTRHFRDHLSFSYKSLPGNILADINTRVDILILGFFLSDEKVGIYSFAAILAEGFTQILVVLKNNINPVLAKMSAQKAKEMVEVVRQGIKLTYKYALILGLASMILYPLIVRLFFGRSDFSQSWPIFAILMAGIMISSGYQPFQMLLAQAGYPGLYTLLIFLVFIINTGLNLILVPVWGLYGSAIATGLSFVASAILLKFLTRRAVQIKI